MSAENTNAGGGETEWHLQGRYVYRNEYGAVGYVDGPGSNPGLRAVVKVVGEGAETIAARVYAALSAQSTQSAGVAAEPVAWLWERCVREYPGEGIWETTATVVRPVANVCCRNIRPLYEHSSGAAEPEAGWRLVPNECTPEMMRAFWLAGPYPEKPFRCGYRAMLAAAPTPPAGGGETEAHPICDRPTLYDRGECCGKTPCAAPASPAGDLISLSAAKIARIIDPISWESWDEIRQPHNGSYGLSGEPEGRLKDHTCARWRHAQLYGGIAKSLDKADEILALAPAAPRKGPSEEEIARGIKALRERGSNQGQKRGATLGAKDPRQFGLGYSRGYHDALDELEALGLADALLTPADRGETQAVGDGA